VAREWLLSGGLSVLRALPQEEARARAILGARRDKDWSLCDAISFAVLETRGARMAFSFDRHFRQYRRFEFLGLDSWRCAR
jgi:predicted nucleic acid-binding protein